MNILQTDPQKQNINRPLSSIIVLQDATDTGGGDEYTQVTLDVTSCEVPFSLDEANSVSPPFSRGQLVRIVKGRASRRKYQGKFGEVASVVRGSEDTDWTIYVLLPGNPLAIALLPNELELINIDSLVGGAA